MPTKVADYMPFHPFQRAAEVRDHDFGRLPHWRQWGATYFATARLADAVPAAVRDAWQQRRDTWLAAHGVSEPGSLPDELRHAFHREFTAAFHTLLDAGHGECAFARAECAEILVAAAKCAGLLAGHGRAYQLDAWVVMPNHLHALIEPAKGSLLGEITKSWKGGSAREINALLGRPGTLRQKESFDHIVRSEAQLEHFRRYIRENPVKAGLSSGFALGVGSQRL